MNKKTTVIVVSGGVASGKTKFVHSLTNGRSINFSSSIKNQDQLLDVIDQRIFETFRTEKQFDFICIECLEERLLQLLTAIAGRNPAREVFFIDVQTNNKIKLDSHLFRNLNLSIVSTDFENSIIK